MAGGRHDVQARTGRQELLRERAAGFPRLFTGIPNEEKLLGLRRPDKFLFSRRFESRAYLHKDRRGMGRGCEVDNPDALRELAAPPTPQWDGEACLPDPAASSKD